MNHFYMYKLSLGGISMNHNNIDMGNMTSKEIGDLMSKTLIERGKEMASKLYPNVDYGDLKAKTLTELGKEAFTKKQK